MQHVITESEARKITGGRKPHVPVVYEEAIRSLDQCINLDDAKLWADKADALAAWANIYHDDKVGRQAKILKLKAFQRMGILAGELRPPKRFRKDRGYLAGGPPGPTSLLVERGLSDGEAKQARTLAKIPEKEFEAVLSRKKIPSPSGLKRDFYSRKQSESYTIFVGVGGPGNCRTFCNRNNPKELASGMSKDEAVKVRETLTEISEWLDEFERCLPK